MKRTGTRYAHHYNGKKNSRGSRTMSKIHRGIKPYEGDIEKAFQEIKKLSPEKSIDKK